MSFKTIVASVALTLSLTVSPIYASPWTVTTTGTISSGYDFAGLFGTPNQNLTGESYILTVTTDPNLNANSTGSSTTGGSYYGYYGAPITVTATVNGNSTTDTINPNINGIVPNDNQRGQNIQALYHSIGPYSFDSIQSSNSGYNQNNTEFIVADIIVSNYVNPTILSSDNFNQSLTYLIQTGDTTFVTWMDQKIIGSGYGAASNFTGTPTSISINPSSIVPIPAAIWLFGSVLAGMIGFGRRKSKSF